jgi:hypothetical protein
MAESCPCLTLRRCSKSFKVDYFCKIFGVPISFPVRFTNNGLSNISGMNVNSTYQGNKSSTGKKMLAKKKKSFSVTPKTCSKVY